METDNNMKKRIFWGHEEHFAIARTFVNLRLDDPFTSDAKLVVKAMKEALPEGKWRAINAMDQIPQVKSRVKVLWEERVTAPVAASAAPPVPDPVVIEIPVEKPIDYAEVLERIDGPTLAALAFAKFDTVLKQLSVARVEVPKPATAPKPPISLLQAATTAIRERKPKVVVIATPNEWPHIREKSEGLSDKLEIEFVDPDKAHGPRRADYVVYKANSSHKVTEPYQSVLGHNRMFKIEGGINSLVAKLYDISSLRRAS